ncbi:VanZ family protein [Zobellia barbeyronii]|uniref:VanZ family protein n=1 Tax=Zobellia barbeyronii TaxID=2748009 RepID=A0ABS5WGL2_9FLAO|nr:VanZ family protein [Zobellia barbeyronii]MBT2162503.1 VanZ family protein [Zobellia barbeyronii]
MLKNHKYTIAFIGWMVFVTFSSLVSFSGTDAANIDIPNLDKVVHFSFYFGAAFLAVFFIREVTNGSMALRKAVLFALIGAVCYGIVIEVLQYSLTTDRHGDIFDALANSVGAIIGSLVVKSFFSKERWLKWRN